MTRLKTRCKINLKKISVKSMTSFRSFSIVLGNIIFFVCRQYSSHSKLMIIESELQSGTNIEFEFILRRKAAKPESVSLTISLSYLSVFEIKSKTCELHERNTNHFTILLQSETSNHEYFFKYIIIIYSIDRLSILER